MAEELLVGLEIHQQLAIPTKLFCACPPVKSEEFPGKFERRLRPAQSETGHLDPAALFEYSKGKSDLYLWNPESSCLVEADEEPPHPLSAEGLEAALLVAATLKSNCIDEVHVMRKIVIDGSNTGGFQRTAVVGLGGSFDADGERVGVQSITLEEDAARNLGEDGGSRRFALDRLGVALVEIALEPVRGDPAHVGAVALQLGRVLRSTGKAARGLGTIRQDMNVSLGGGRVVEVKGVQKLNLIPKVVEYERRRQSMLRAVAA
ncbi:MAG: Glu-tRNA(Gln) amidotransferase GatDE subunit E, partial [Nitrososphaerota archaeon]|nr:Glu-tRNA(Gln) amidotransferase GatDE subunit E [Nitrososphaerota archaeon]